jgi:hypothetical protein
MSLCPVLSLYVCTVINLKAILILGHCTYHQKAKMDSKKSKGTILFIVN